MRDGIPGRFKKLIDGMTFQLLIAVPFRLKSFLRNVIDEPDNYHLHMIDNRLI